MGIYFLQLVRQIVYTLLMATKTERLNLRLTPTQDAILRTAAEARGESTSDYVLRHAVAAAEIDLADRRVFVADEMTWMELKSLLDTSSMLPEAMSKLISEPSILEE